MVTIEVDETAPPLHERLELEVVLDDDLVLSVAGFVEPEGRRAKASYYDLEFGLGLPAVAVPGGGGQDPKDRDESVRRARARPRRARERGTRQGPIGRPRRRAVHAQLVGVRPPPTPDGATEAQVLEHLYYQPCSGCERAVGGPRMPVRDGLTWQAQRPSCGCSTAASKSRPESDAQFA